MKNSMELKHVPEDPYSPYLFINGEKAKFEVAFDYFHQLYYNECGDPPVGLIEQIKDFPCAEFIEQFTLWCGDDVAFKYGHIYSSKFSRKGEVFTITCHFDFSAEELSNPPVNLLDLLRYMVPHANKQGVKGDFNEFIQYGLDWDDIYPEFEYSTEATGTVGEKYAALVNILKLAVSAAEMEL